MHKTNADPYKGIDVRGVAGRPPEVVEGEACNDIFSPQQYAAKNGALAVLFFSDSNNAASMARLNTHPSPNGPPFVVKDSQPASASPPAPTVTAGLELTNALFAGERGAEILYTAADLAVRDRPPA